MKSISSDDYTEGKLPVFVFPTSLNFYLDDQSSQKQVLTLYNPYEFTVKFRVLCNNPTKYNVVESEGLIRQKCCIDIVIRVINLTQLNGGKEDKFRIQLYEHGLSKPLGKKDIPAVLLQSEKGESSHTKHRSRKQSQREIDEFLIRQTRDSVVVQRSLPSVPVILISIVCVIALMLPTQGDITAASSRVPDYLHLTVNQKLIVAYILGLVTMAVLKT